MCIILYYKFRLFLKKKLKLHKHLCEKVIFKLFNPHRYEPWFINIISFRSLLEKSSHPLLAPYFSQTVFWFTIWRQKRGWLKSFHFFVRSAFNLQQTTPAWSLLMSTTVIVSTSKCFRGTLFLKSFKHNISDPYRRIWRAHAERYHQSPLLHFRNFSKIHLRDSNPVTFPQFLEFLWIADEVWDNVQEERRSCFNDHIRAEDRSQ